ncbi:hypothetical protein PsorP6_014779 [Peronosclerospora sorghi]|uniref:Uncharacterized protein n=1 Tax=Peronosclerospora sorghi TaxID=230839 RepID=A0ACC0VSU7_9STRA|nr:hypothetical protein PsorP6_014779 [Peronosclerospora sorghi]
MLDRYGPQVMQSLGALARCPACPRGRVCHVRDVVARRAFLYRPRGLCLCHESKYWTSITFARNVVGAANAITGGLGLAGIGVAFLVLPFVFQLITGGGHVSEDVAWRLTIALPALLMLVMGLVIRVAVDSCPTGAFHDLLERKQRAQGAEPSNRPPPSTWLASFRLVVTDTNVLIMMVQYAASFGTELQLNNMGALYFYQEFTTTECTEGTSCSLLSPTSAATVASSFGLMNAFARALGGLVSDALNRRHGLRGRQYGQFVLLCLVPALVLAFRHATSIGPSVAFYVLLAIAAQATGGSAYGIVPYLNEQHIGTVNGVVVGAGGNLGGALFRVVFRTTGSYQTGLLYMAIFILSTALLTPLLRFAHVNDQVDAREDAEPDASPSAHDRPTDESSRSYN